MSLVCITVCPAFRVASAGLVTGNDYRNYLFGTMDADTILGKGADDRLYGLAGADSIYGGSGDDILEGDQGNDNLNGEPGCGPRSLSRYRGSRRWRGRAAAI